MTEPAANEPTLTEALAVRGLTHRPAKMRVQCGRRDVLDGDRVILRMVTAHEVWEWLAEQESEND